jgi:FixJ family two-component response regulator
VLPQNQTLYIVDGLPESCENLVALAEANGIGNESFSSAEAFLTSYNPPRFGCVLTGHRLAGMTGLELQQQLVRLVPALPVILLTAFADVRLAVKALKGGAYSVLEKPCDPDELLDLVRRAFEFNRCMHSTQERWETLHGRFQRLDPRHQQVLNMMLEGVPNKAMFRKLDISPRTLNRVRAEVLATVGAKSLVELARIAEELRIGDPHSDRMPDKRSAAYRLDQPAPQPALNEMHSWKSRSDSCRIS